MRKHKGIRITAIVLACAGLVVLISWENTAEGTFHPPVGHWGFDEGAGTTTADASGNGNTGTLINGPAWVPGVLFPGALDFDGVDDYVRVPNSATLSPTSAITITSWFKPEQTITGTADYFQSLIDSGSYSLYFDKSTGQLKFAVNSASAESWTDVGAKPVGDTVYALAVYKGELYIGGNFTNAGNKPNADYIAKWDGASWNDVGGVPLSSTVWSLAVYNGELYIGGNFLDAAGILTADFLAKWNGSFWSDVGGTAFNSTVYSLAAYNGELYVGGTFTSPATRIARWNGSFWSSVGAGANSTVYVLATYKGELYAAGTFTSPSTRIAKWNGSLWSAVGVGANSTVYALAVYNDELYAGGAFTSPATRIARWNGSSWSSVGAGTNSTVYTLAAYNGELYVGGSFTSPSSYIAKWNGSSWGSVGGGLSSTVRTLAVYNAQLFAGGSFLDAGGLNKADRLAIFSSGNDFELGSATSTWTASPAWFHIAAKYDGTTATIYVNGAPETTLAVSAGISSLTTNVFFGQAYGARGAGLSAQPLEGILDDVRIYDRALSDAEVATLAANQPPIANAGPDQTVSDVDNNGIEGVLLNGSASFDVDGFLVNYEWYEGATLIATGVSPVYNFTVGPHTVTLTITDDDGAINSDTVVITVDPPPPAAPFANAGPDQTVVDLDGSGSEDVLLDGSGSADTDGGTIVSYDWTGGGLPATSGVSPIVTLAVGVHTITLTVTDDDGLSAMDTTIVEVIEPPPSPTNTSGWAWSSNTGWMSFNSIGCDSDGDGFSDGAPAGCPVAGTPVIEYGVHVDVIFPGDVGKFIGRAWSDRVGWVKFDTSTIPPGEVIPSPVRLDLTAGGTVCGTGTRYDICGWARACSAVANKSLCEGPADPDAGGWDGWIQMRGTTPAMPRENLIGHWKLDETSGPIANDSSGNSYDGILVMDQAWQPTGGQIQGALQFDATDDYIDLNTFDLPVGSTQITLAAWVKSSNLFNCPGSDCRMISKATDTNAPNTYWMLATDDVGGNVKMRFRLKTGGSTRTLTTTTATFPVDRWVHVAATYDGTTMRVYQDGAQEGSTGATGIIDTNPAVETWIGNNPPERRKDFGGKPWAGLIDDVRVYDRALTLTEIQQLALTAPVENFGVNWNPLTQELEGFAWGGETMGWLSFNCLNDHDAVTPGVQTACASSDYQVIVDLTEPRAENLTFTQLDHCGGVSEPKVRLSWTFVDADPLELQDAYQVQISSNSSFTAAAIVRDTCSPFPFGTCTSGNTSTEYVPPGLAFGTTYWWRLKVWDDTDVGTPTGWVYPSSPPGSPSPAPGTPFTTRLHGAPAVSFSFLPSQPAVDELVEFDETATCYSAPGNTPYACSTSGAIRYEWDFNNPSAIDCDSNLTAVCRGDQTHVYSSPVINNTVLLRVTDELGDGLGACTSVSDPFTITIPFPGWREISPL